MIILMSSIFSFLIYNNTPNLFIESMRKKQIDVKIKKEEEKVTKEED